MNSTAKLTRQGVRDLDFGWKKKPTAAAPGSADEAEQTEDAPPPVSGAAREIEDETAPSSEGAAGKGSSHPTT